MASGQLLRKNHCFPPQTAGLATLQCVHWHTCRIITWFTWLVGSMVFMPGSTWVTMRAVVGAAVQSSLDVFLVFCVLVGCARFERQLGHVMTERVQWSAVTRWGCLTELLCYLCNVQRREYRVNTQLFAKSNAMNVLYFWCLNQPT